MWRLLSAVAWAPAAGLTHGWDCVMCASNSMLASNFGTWRADINLTDDWWVNVTADSHAVVILNNFWKQGPGSYNGTGDDSKVLVARRLKARNPNLAVFFYQPADRLGDTEYVLRALDAHPEWWLRDDFGNVIPFRGGSRKQIDHSVPAAQDFFANLSVSLFHGRDEAARLLDGVMVDGTSWTGARRYGPNVSAARYEALFRGKMAMLAKMQRILRELNGHGEVWGNPLLEYNVIGDPGNPGRDWNTTLPFYAGAFDEMFGSFGTMDQDTGAWDVAKMRWSFDAIVNASAAGKTVAVHAFPGPAGGDHAAFPFRGRGKNSFRVSAWAGATPVPADPAACRRAAAERLVESLAPFLLVASERTFFSYGWFYNLEDGYLPCPAEIECGMPGEWYPEFGKKLGAPRGPASTDATRTVWQRRFQHASVFVDLRNRSASTITWDEDTEVLRQEV